MKKFLNKLVRNENGATAIEYGLIAALLAIGIIGAVQGVRTSLRSTFTTVQTQLDTAASSKS